MKYKARTLGTILICVSGLVIGIVVGTYMPFHIALLLFGLITLQLIGTFIQTVSD